MSVPRTPDVQAQRTAIKKLSFLVGKWSGEAYFARAWFCGGSVWEGRIKPPDYEKWLK